MPSTVPLTTGTASYSMPSWVSAAAVASVCESFICTVWRSLTSSGVRPAGKSSSSGRTAWVGESQAVTTVRKSRRCWGPPAYCTVTMDRAPSCS